MSRVASNRTRRRNPKLLLWGSPGVSKSHVVASVTEEQIAKAKENWPGELEHLRREVARLMKKNQGDTQ